MTTTVGIWIAAAAIIAASYGAWLVKPIIDKKLKSQEGEGDLVAPADTSHTIVLNTAEAEVDSIGIEEGEPDPDAISGQEKSDDMPDVLNMAEAEVDSIGIKEGTPDPNGDFFDEDPAEEEAEAIQEQLMKDTYEKPKSKRHGSAKHYNGNQEVKDFEEKPKSKKRGRPRKTKITTD